MPGSSPRVAALDIVRGFALLGILTMNISLALPAPARLVPTAAGGFTGGNYLVWVLGFLLFDEKMITLFAMLFGAGLFLLGEKGVGWRRLLIRQAMLLIIGLIHAYLIWEGDILVSYAICGFIVYPLRRLPVPRQVAIALCLWLISIASAVAFSRIAVSDKSVQSEFQPTPAEIQRSIMANRNATWLEAARHRAPEAADVQLVFLPASLVWTVSARMLLGIALFRTGLLAGAWTTARYLRTAAIGYGVGFPIVVFAMYGLLEHRFEVAYLFSVGLTTNQAGSFFVAVGHACVLIAAWKSGLFGSAFERLASVGRLALSNYLSQSLIATWIFNGYGLAQFGRWNRMQLSVLVVAIWVLQLWWSPLWLRRFRLGPAEWLWRTTSGRGQP